LSSSESNTDTTHKGARRPLTKDEKKGAAEVVKEIGVGKGPNSSPSSKKPSSEN